MARRTSATLVALISLAATGLIVFSAWAGPLNPPGGPVTSTNKTLTEVEPRIAINATNTPGDADSVFRIAGAGSYYLAGNVTGVSGKAGIEIASNDVTVDLMGFELLGVAGSLAGVRTPAAVSGLTIRNGSIRSWPTGGIAASAVSSSVIVEGVTATGNTGAGIACGTDAVVRSCVATSNTGDGISVGNDSTVTECAARVNGSAGIRVGNGCTVSRCVSADNTSTGIVIAFSCSATGCAVFSNNGDGISGSSSNSVLDCAVAENNGNGIVVDFNSVVRGNTVVFSGLIGTGSNIRVTGTRTRVERNLCNGGDIGIEVTSTNCLIIGNSCGNNTTNYSIAAGNRYGPIVDISAVGTAAVSGSSAASTLTTTDPNANFAH